MNFLKPFSLKRAAKIRTFFKPPNFFTLFFNIFSNFVLERVEKAHKLAKNREKMVSYWQIFTTFAKIGAFTIGGGYAMLPIIQSELIKRGWLREDDFTDIVALAQSAPGLLAVNISIFTGHKLRGTLGSIVATLGSVLPSFLIILAIAMVFSDFQNNPTVIRIFKGIRPVVVALIAVPMINMAKKANRSWWAWLVSAASLALVAFLNVSPIYILLTIIIISAAAAKFMEGRK